MGQRDIRRLLITGAMAVVRWALRRGAPQNHWLARMLQRKPPLVVRGHDLRPRKRISGITFDDHLRTLAAAVRAWSDRIAG